MAGNQPNPLPAWGARSPLNLTLPLHNLPQAFDKLLPKFDLEERTAIDDHLQRFYLALEGLRAGEYEDLVCRLFPHTLKGAAASWYFFFLQTLFLIGTLLKGFSEVNIQPRKLTPP